MLEGAGMKFFCLGYLDLAKWQRMSVQERNSWQQQRFAYDKELRRAGYFLGGALFQPAEQAVSVRLQNDQVAVGGGPWFGGHEQVASLILLDARDLNHAIQLLSKHPGIRAGGFEIRTVGAPATTEGASKVTTKLCSGEGHEVPDAHLRRRKRHDRRRKTRLLRRIDTTDA
jgi:hypothetical protein